MKPKRVILGVLLLISANNLLPTDAKEVPFIHKCKAEDSECIKKSAQAAVPIVAVGIPSFGVDTVDPLRIDKIDASGPDLNLILTDVIVTGLKNSIVKRVSRDIVNPNIFVELWCAFELNGHYDMSGQLLNIPVEGQGNIKIVFKNVNVSSDGNIKYIEKANGKSYWHLTDWRHTFELLDKATIVMENLFNGNEAKAKTVQDAIDSNTNVIVTEMGKPIITRITDMVMMTIDQFYGAVPAEDLALD